MKVFLLKQTVIDLKQAVIDAHVHLDLYDPPPRRSILRGLPLFQVEAMIAVSMHAASCRRNRALHRRYPERVFPAYGFHPEQRPIGVDEADRLLEWIAAHRDEAVAMGEVGLPYYTRSETESRGEAFDSSPYYDLLERFIQLAKALNKPVVLHAVYEDADPACDLLEKYGVKKAHFHWFKGPPAAIRRMIGNGYFISVTPDIVYEPEIQELARLYPLEQIMVETDGPWPFEGPFAGETTHPRMIHQSIGKIAEIKKKKIEDVYRQVYRNTVDFYDLRHRLPVPNEP